MAITCKSFAKHCTTAHDTKPHALQDLAHVQRDVVVSNLTLTDGPIEAIKFESLHVKLMFFRNSIIGKMPSQTTPTK